MNLKLKKIIDFIFIIILVFYSGSVYIMLYPLGIPLLFLFFSIYLFLQGKQKIFNKVLTDNIFSKVSIIYLIFTSLHFILLSNANLTSYVSLYCKIFTAALFVMYYKQKLLEYYIKILRFICKYSFIIWLLLFIPKVLSILLLIGLDVPATENPFDKSLIFYHLNPNAYTKDPIRNSGPFWEPGAFVLFIIVSLIFQLLIMRKNNLLRNKWELLCLLSTFSTAGYIALFIFIGTYYILKKHNYFQLLFISIVAAYAFYNFDFLNDKLENEIEVTENSDKEYRSRYASVILDSEMIQRYPLLGSGYSDERYPKDLYGYREGTLSSFLDVFSRWGVLFGGGFIFCIFYSFLRISQSKAISFTAVLTYVLIGFSQYFYMHSFFIIMPFLYMSSLKRQINKRHLS